MKVKLEVAPDADVVLEKGEDGRVKSITLVPFFATQKGSATLLYGTSTSDQGEQLDRFVLSVSPQNGTISKRSRHKPIRPLVDLSNEERAKLGEQPGDDDEDDEEDENAPRNRRS